ncbi:MAG: PQQ-binding-like beta-propeller repeat protein, partial [Acidobacteriota bacterium]
DDNRLHAVDAMTGERRWAFAFGEGGEQSSPAVVDGVVYFGAFDHKVYALDAQTGDLRWSYDASAGMLSSPAVDEGRLYIGVMDGTVHAVDAGSGEPLWVFKAGDKPIFASPTLADGALYIGAYDDHLYALGTDDGAERWRRELGGPIFSTAAVAGGRVWIGAGDGFYSIDPGTGEVRWKSPEATGSVFGSAAVSAPADRAYIGSSDMGLLIYSLDGALVHRVDVGDKVWSSVTVVSDGRVFVGAHYGHIYGFGRPAPEPAP